MLITQLLMCLLFLVARRRVENAIISFLWDSFLVKDERTMSSACDTIALYAVSSPRSPDDPLVHEIVQHTNHELQMGENGIETMVDDRHVPICGLAKYWYRYIKIFCTSGRLRISLTHHRDVLSRLCFSGVCYLFFTVQTRLLLRLSRILPWPLSLSLESSLTEYEGCCCHPHSSYQAVFVHIRS